jgi:hypothetical protein
MAFSTSAKSISSSEAIAEEKGKAGLVNGEDAI